MKNKSQDLFWSFVTKIINYHVIFYSHQKLRAGTSLEVTPLEKKILLCYAFSLKDSRKEWALVLLRHQSETSRKEAKGIEGERKSYGSHN